MDAAIAHIDHVPAASQDGLRLRLGILGPLFFLGQMAWSLAAGSSGTLLQALFADIDPHHKIALYGTMGTISSIAAAVVGIVAGALSDRTRSRFGARKPWIVAGGLAAPMALAMTGVTHSVVLIIAASTLYQMAQAAMLAAMMALLPDLLDRSVLGKASAIAGLGVLSGQIGSGVVAALFVTTPAVGLKIVPWGIAIVAILMAIFLPARSSAAASPTSRTTLWQALVPPSDGQFWWAFVGRFFFILSFAMTIVFQLYILTDYMGLKRQQAGDILGTGMVMFAITAAVCTLSAGVLSDRLKRRKVFVIGASLLVAVATLPLAIVASPWTLLLFFALAGCGFGAYISVDQALMVEVLPDEASVARDLSFLSSSNSLPLACAPAVAGMLATKFGYAVMFDASIAAALIGAVCIFGIRRVR